MAQARSSALRLGWDVGAWHCDSGSSRDALVLLELGNDGPQLRGRPWRGNLRAVLSSASGVELVQTLVRLCDPTIMDWSDLVVAIDTPLGWPRAMQQLVANQEFASKILTDSANPYTRRETELELCRRGFQPLSTVRDMIGSQSTKGLHFLAKAGFEKKPSQHWQIFEDGLHIRAIEAYPAVAIRSAQLSCILALLGQPESWPGCSVAKPNARLDIRDAAICALLAHLWADIPESCERPPDDVPAGEGWIILPGDIAALRDTSAALDMKP